MLRKLRLFGTLARKNEKLPHFWYVGTWARGHIDHAGSHGTRFRKLNIQPI